MAYSSTLTHGPTSSWETSFYESTYTSSSHHHHIPTASVTASSSKVPKSQRTQRLTDKITRLQKLVSPYGKTDTASVLLEASITIDALHNQIKNLLPSQFGHLQTYETGEERFKLQSKGLCLVPADCCNSQST